MKTTELKPYAKQWINCDRGWKNHTYIKLDCLSLSYPTQSLLKMHFRHCPRCNLKSIQKHGKESQWKNLQQKGLQKRWVFKICCFILNFYEIPTFPSAMLMEVRVCCRAGSWWLPGWKSCLGSGVTRHSVRSHSGPPSFPASPWARHQQESSSVIASSWPVGECARLPCGVEGISAGSSAFKY